MRLVCFDTGIGWEHARRFAEEGWEVIIHRPTISNSFPRLRYVIPGFGFKNIKIGDGFKAIRQGCDLVMITDLPTGELAEFLREQGIPVFGGGKAERLELDRVWAKQKMREYGIKFPKTWVVRGLGALKTFIEGHLDSEADEGKGFSIKIDTFRGDFETQVVKTKEEAEQVLSNIDNAFGPYAKVVRFIIEEYIPDAILVGGDWFFDGNHFAPTYHFSMELRPDCIGKWVKESIPVLDDMKERLERLLKELGYRGMYSNEILYDGKNGYMIDQNVRPPYPLSLSFPTVIKNYTDIVQACAKGDLGDLDLEVDEPFVGIMVVSSSIGKEHYLPLHIKGDDVRLGFRDAIMIDGIIYSVPIDGHIGVTISTGRTLDELLDNMSADIEKVDIIKKDIPSVEKFNEALKIARKYHLDFLFD